MTPVTEGTVYVHIPAGGADDLATNLNSISNSLEFYYDINVPTVTLVADVPSSTNAASYLITFTFNELVIGFDVSKITTTGTNLALSDFTEVTTQEVFTVKATPTSDGTKTFEVEASKVTDLSLNNNAASSVLTIQADISRPTVTIAVPAVTNAAGATVDPLLRAAKDEPFLLTATFSETITSFLISDFVSTGLTLSSLVNDAANDKIWTVQLRSTSSLAGATVQREVMQVYLPENAVVDLASNLLNVGNTLNFLFDNQQPTLSITEPALYVSTNPTPVTVTADEGVYGLAVADVHINYVTAHRYWRIATAVETTLAWRVNYPVAMYRNSLTRRVTGTNANLVGCTACNPFASSMTTNLPKFAFDSAATGTTGFWEEYYSDSKGDVSTLTVTGSMGSETSGMAISEWDKEFIYITESSTCVVKRITISTGAVEDIVGNGCAITAIDEFGTKARFVQPMGIAWGYKDALAPVPANWFTTSASYACQTNDDASAPTVTLTVTGFTLAQCKHKCQYDEGWCVAIDYFSATKKCNLYSVACEEPTFIGDGSSSYRFAAFVERLFVADRNANKVRYLLPNQKYLGTHVTVTKPVALQIADERTLYVLRDFAVSLVVGGETVRRPDQQTKRNMIATRHMLCPKGSSPRPAAFPQTPAGVLAVHGSSDAYVL